MASDLDFLYLSGGLELVLALHRLRINAQDSFGHIEVWVSQDEVPYINGECEEIFDVR